MLKTTESSVDPFDYHLEICGSDCFKKLLKCSRIHSSLSGMESGDIEEDFNIHELDYTDGSNEVVKLFNQKCVICLNSDSDCIFKQCRHQCICDKLYQNRSHFNISKWVVCRT